MSHSCLPFQRYDDEFKSLKMQVQQSLQSNDEFRDKEQPGNSANTSALVSQCEDLLQQEMALEARSVPDAALKRELFTQVRTCKSELQSLKKHNKQSLMSGGRQFQSQRTFVATTRHVVAQSKFATQQSPKGVGRGGTGHLGNWDRIGEQSRPNSIGAQAYADSWYTST
jgi:hypothetical protein